MTFDDCADIRENAFRKPAGGRSGDAGVRAPEVRVSGPFDWPRTGAGHVGPDVLAGVEAYWNDLRNGARVPRRSDVNPEGIATALPAAMILERVAPGIARIRVAGQQIVRACGMDPRGMPLGVYFAGPSRDGLGAHLEVAFAGPAIVSIPLTIPRRLLRGAVRGQLLVLPLDNGSGTVDRALALLVTESRIDRRGPVRFRLSGTETPRIDIVPVPRYLRRSTSADGPGAPAAPIENDDREAPRLRRNVDRRFVPFQVFSGDRKMAAPAAPSDSRPALSLVISNH